jgi:dipeptide/tripeptide permease
MKKAGTSTQINISVTGSIVGYWFFVWALLKNKNNDNDDDNNNNNNKTNTTTLLASVPDLVIWSLANNPNQTANVIVLCTPFQMIIFPPIVQANTTTNANQRHPYVLF